MKKILSVFLLFAILVSSPFVAVRSFASADDGYVSNIKTVGYVGNSNKIKAFYNTETKTLVLYGNGKIADDEWRMDPLDVGEFGPFWSASWREEV